VASNSQEHFDPIRLVEQSLDSRIAAAEAEAEQLAAEEQKLEQDLLMARDRQDHVRVIEAHVLNNLKQFTAEDVRGVFQDLLQASARIELLDMRSQTLRARAAEIRESVQFLGTTRQIVTDLGRIHSDERARLNNQEEQRDASRQVFQVIEEERMRIARDMHDGPAQSMANLVLQAEILERMIARDPAKVANELAEFKSSVRSALEEIRQLIFDLRPMILDDLGLIPTLRKFIKEYGDKFGLQTRFNVVGDERRLAPNLEGALFRIIQESLTNIHKHARGRTADITLNLQPTRVLAVIKDDGVGFDVAAVQANLHRRRHFGLLSMRERTALEKGQLEIRSQTGRGTEVRVEFRLDRPRDR
jgi:two-component system sensor histidine kinase DegS